MYSAVSDIKKLIPEESLIQLTDDENLGTVNQGRVDEAIQQADSEIDSYCGGRYSVPFAVVPGIIKKISVDVAIYNLYSRRVEEIPQTRADRYKNAIRQLELISKGSISIGVDPEPAAPSKSNTAVQVVSSPKIFGRDNMKGF
ncbi:hypothetical protein A2V82_16525 [candidate division KSB1 bacterium RBG_16_48_16]|nr:MAG: hypothetical protein A2V82_16525 [candidate division KSB1 bacterium RBG_16_48_16]